MTTPLPTGPSGSARCRRRRHLAWIHALLLGWIASLAALGAGVPGAAQSFDPSASFLLYADIGSVSRSPVGKAIAEQIKDLSANLPKMPGVPQGAADLPAKLPSLQSLQGVELAEIALVATGNLNTSSGAKLDPNSSFLAVARLSKTLENQEELIQQLLQLLDESRPGMSAKVTSTRGREGAADWFELTGETLGAPELPYSIALALGPGEKGTVLALGRAERVRSFLKGESSGQLPAPMGRLLPRRGDIWMYAAIPENASRGLQSSGAPGIAGNPMAEGMLGAFDQIKDMALNLSFGATAMDLEVAFGCRSADSAKQMADQVQGLAGMMQMMTAQNPANAPQYFSKLQVQSEGTQFRLTTSVTARDLQLARQEAGSALGGSGFSSGSGASGKATVVVEPLETAIPPPLKIEYLGLVSDSATHVPRGKFRITGQTDESIRDARITFHYMNARGIQIGKWTRNQRDPYSEVLISGMQKREVEWPLFSLPPGTSDVTVTLQEVNFTSGQRWRINP